jgi:phage anti-repressor protein
MKNITIHDVEFTKDDDSDFFYPSEADARCEVIRPPGYVVMDICRLSDGVEFRCAQVRDKEKLLTQYEGEIYLDGKIVAQDKRDTLGVRILTDDLALLMLPEGWVDAAMLHFFLRVKKDFTSWVKNRVESAQLVEGEDFRILTNLGENVRVGRPRAEYWLSVDAAKHCAMLEGGERGRRIRQYFIDSEKRARLMFSDPLTAAKMYVEAEEKRREAQQHLEVAKAETQEMTAQVDVLVDKLEAPNRDVHLKQFFKETADVLGYSPVTGYKYLVDAGILVAGQGTKWDKTYAPSAAHDRRGLFRIVTRKYPKPVGEPDGAGSRKVVEVEKTVVMLTRDTLDSEGAVLKVGGYSWLRKKMLRDPRTTLSRLVASEGGPNGAWAPLYGCALRPVSTPDLLTARGYPSIIRYYHAADLWRVARFSGKSTQTTEGKTLTEALRALLAATPTDSIKPLSKNKKANTNMKEASI